VRLKRDSNSFSKSAANRVSDAEIGYRYICKLGRPACRARPRAAAARRDIRRNSELIARDSSICRAILRTVEYNRGMDEDLRQYLGAMEERLHGRLGKDFGAMGDDSERWMNDSMEWKDESVPTFRGTSERWKRASVPVSRSLKRIW
jgi:hypothetical protein